MAPRPHGCWGSCGKTLYAEATVCLDCRKVYKCTSFGLTDLLKQRKIGESTLVLTPEQLEKAEKLAAQVRAWRAKLDKANKAKMKDDGDSAAARAEANRKRLRGGKYQREKAQGKKANVAADRQTHGGFTGANRGADHGCFEGGKS